MPKSKAFVPLKSFKPITNERQARKATSEFHGGGGNRSAYQAASALLTDLHKTTSKFVFRTVTNLGLRPKAGGDPISTLEVGAVNTQLLDSPFLEVTAIDLKSRHPRIEERDFFSVPATGEYSMLVLAMVLNCVPTAEKRGEMLTLCRNHLRDDGLLFFVIPSRCLPGGKREEFNSRIMSRLGFEVVVEEATPKVFSTCFRAVRPPEPLEETVKFKDGGDLLDIVLHPKGVSTTASKEKGSAGHAKKKTKIVVDAE